MHIFLIKTLLAAAAFAVQSGQRTTVAPPPEPAAISADDPLRDMVWNEALDAGTNARYWSMIAENTEWWEEISRWAAILTGIFCFAFPFISRHYVVEGKGAAESWKVKLAGMIVETVSVLAFGASLFTMLDHRDTYKDLASIQSRWATLQPDFQSLFKLSHTLSHSELQEKYDALMRAKQSIIPIEPAGKDNELMHKAWVQEMFAQKVDPEYIAKVEEDRAKLKLNPTSASQRK